MEHDILKRYGRSVEEDEAYKISTARIVLVDYTRLFEDFDQLRPSTLFAEHPDLRALTEPKRTSAVYRIADEWILDNAALISSAQATQSTANTAIGVEGAKRRVFRPPRYGRACIAEVQSLTLRLEELSLPVQVPAGGELDIKGVGVRRGFTPVRGGYHSDGLLSTRDAIEELLTERFIDIVLAHAGAAYSTLPHYAVLDTGFDGFTATGERFPAGLLVRRAHMRNLDSDLPSCDTSDQYAVFEVEMLLRQYGLTSAKRATFEIREIGDRLVAFQWGKATGYSHDTLNALVKDLGIEVPFEAEGVNVQMDFSEESEMFGYQLVDFGQYFLRDTFDRAIVSLVRDRPLGWGGIIIPTDKCFVQPDPRLALQGAACRDVNQQAGPFASIAGEIAADFQSGKLDRLLESRISALFAKMVGLWPSTPTAVTGYPTAVARAQ